MPTQYHSSVQHTPLINRTPGTKNNGCYTGGVMLIRNSVRPTVATVVGIITLLSTATMIAAQTVATTTDSIFEATTTPSLLPDLNKSTTTTLSLLPDFDGSATTTGSTSTSTLAESPTITDELSPSAVAELETTTATESTAAPTQQSPTPTFDIATSTFPAELTCDMAYTADLYDTVSGHEEPGAAVIGSQSWTVCKDEQGHAHEIKITPSEYGELALPRARMPRKTTADLPESVTSATTTAPKSAGLPEIITETTPVTTISTSTAETGVSTVPDTTLPEETATSTATTDTSITASTEESLTQASTTPDTPVADDTATSSTSL